MCKNISIRDLLYFDFEKAASLLSQLEGGLTEKISEAKESEEDERNIRKYELLNLFKSEFGGIAKEKHSIIESKVLHHDLLNRIEFGLDKLEMVADLNALLESEISDINIIHNAIGEKGYLRTEGWAVFEDYKRLTEVCSVFL
jgi:hypothetical protein